MTRAVLVEIDAADAVVAPALIDALQAHLASLAELISTLDQAAYQATPGKTTGSVGEHVRHCLDHARALLSSAEADTLTYDSRLRGSDVERSPLAAIGEIDRVSRQLPRLDAFALERPISLVAMTHRDLPQATMETTLGREVAFVIQHTIHHCALVAMQLDRLGIEVPARFGYAPSTPGRH